MRKLFSYFRYSNKSGQSKSSTLLYYFLLLYIVSLFIYGVSVLVNVLMVSLLLIGIIKTPLKSYRESFLNNKILLPILLFFLFHFISLKISANINEGLDVVVKRLPLFIFPLAFCFIEFPQKTWNKILLFYAVITVLASLCGFSYGIYMAERMSDKGYLYNDNIGSIIGKQAVYFAFYVNAAIIILIHQLFKKDISGSLKLICVLGIAWLLFFDIMLASKTSLIGLGIILIAVIGIQILKNKKWLEGILFALSLLVCVFLVNKIFPKIANRFIGITETSYNFENKNLENHFNAAYDKNKWNSTNTRVALWQCAKEVFLQHPFLGTGIGDRDQALQEKYKEKKFIYAINTQKNTHNQYLEVGVSMGILGLLVFLFGFVAYPFVTLFKYRQILALSIFVILAICFVTENMLDRYQGEIIISFILPLVTKLGKKEINPRFPEDTY